MASDDDLPETVPRAPSVSLTESGGAMHVPIAGAPIGRGHQRRCTRHRRRPEEGTNDTSSDVAADHSVPASRTCLLGFDPLTLTVWPHDVLHGRDDMDYPMLEEFATSIAASRIVTWPPLDRLASSPADNQLEDRATMTVHHVYSCGMQTPSQHANSDRTPLSRQWTPLGVASTGGRH